MGLVTYNRYAGLLKQLFDIAVTCGKNALSLFIRGIEAGLFQPDSGHSTDALPLVSTTTPESHAKSDFVFGSVTTEAKDSNAAQHPADGNWSLPNAVSMPSFVGREKEIADLRRLLSEHRIVTLKGTGGIGKTRLAHELLALPDELPWAEKRAFVTFEHLIHDTREAIVDALASQLGVSLRPDRNGIAAIVANLQTASTLLVVDNCETSLATLPSLLLDLLNRCPRLRILATSQRELGIQDREKVYPLPCLPVPKQGSAERASLETASVCSRAE